MGQVGQARSELPVTQSLSIPWEPATLKTVFIPLSSQTDAPTVPHHHLHLQPRSSGATFADKLGAVIGSVVGFAVLLLILWRCCASNDGNSRRTSSSRSSSPDPPRGPLKPPRGPLKPPRGPLNPPGGPLNPPRGPRPPPNSSNIEPPPVMAQHPAPLPLPRQGNFPPPPPDIHLPEDGSQEGTFSIESDEGTEFNPRPHRRPPKRTNTLQFLAGQQSLLGVPYRMQDRRQLEHKT